MSSDLTTRILFVRGQSVMLDEDLAKIYGVTTKRLNEQYRRNEGRFPDDFAFQLTAQEVVALRSQIATSKEGRGGRRYRPLVFTEHGAIMLASVLNSKVAVAASVNVVRAFVSMREAISRNKKLAEKFAEIEGRLDGHDETLVELFAAIRQLIEGSEEADGSKREIGFHVKNARNGKAAVGI
ncbi:MAG: ORF6N domain-containing protein [Limisphaerales bacterium]